MLTGSVRIDVERGRALPYDRLVTEAIAFTAFESYLDREQLAGRRHELVGGRVYALAGGSERHDLAAGLIYEALASGARSSGCRPFTSNRLVRTRGGNAYYPDVMVACGPAAHRLYETDPALIVEVLSPSTGDVDRREKAVAYAESTSLGLLLLVDPGNRRIEVARPAGGRIHDWTVYGPGDVVSTAFGDLDVDAICDAVDETATTT
jgi:Uma2 family endonuclease